MVTFTLNQKDIKLNKLVSGKFFSDPKDIIEFLEDYMFWKIIKSSLGKEKTYGISLLENQFLWK